MATTHVEPADPFVDRGGTAPGVLWAVLAFVAILVGVVFAITRSGSPGHSHGSGRNAGVISPASVESGRSKQYKPVNGCTLLTNADIQLLTTSEGAEGEVIGSPRSSFSNDLVESLTPPGPGWVTECDWTGGIAVPAGDPEACFWGGNNEPGITVSLTQRIDPSEAAAASYLKTLGSTPLQPDHSLDGSSVGNGASGDLTVETSYFRWDAATSPVLPPRGCEMGRGPVATLYVLVGGSRLGGGITATLTLSVYSQWDEMWGHAPPLTALAAVARRALSNLPT